MEHISEALAIITGGKSFGYYIAGFFFSFLAIVLSLRIHSKTRDVYSKNTPVKFSWRFLLWDNTKRMVATLITMFLLFRVFDFSSVVSMIGVGFAVSFGLDKMIELLMDHTSILNVLKPARKKNVSSDADDANT